MNKIKIRFISILTIFLILIQFIIPFTFNNISSAATNKDVYDVILFWGQSNMTGYCGKYDTDAKAEEKGSNNESKPDPRYTYSNSSSVSAYSTKSGIDKEFLSNSVQMNWVKISQTSNTVYDYKYTTNKLVELTADTKNLGEKLIYNSSSKKLEVPTGAPYSIEKSYGTNLIPQFCKTYYQKTGHKVVAVFAANGGEKLANFLPSTDSDYGDINNQMIYEAMAEKYKAAINYMNSKGYIVKNKLWVCFQGESDVTAGTSTSEYKRLFLKIHNKLKKDVNITKGAIIETSTTIGRAKYQEVNNVHNAQVQLASENKDIILGSSYAYDRFIPDKTTYNSSSYTNSIYTDSNGGKINYDNACKIAKYGMCDPGNTIHFTSAALSQIGKETATLLANAVDITPPTLSVGYSTTELTNQNVIATITSNEQIQSVNGWTLSTDKKTLTKTYSSNNSSQITIYDIAGNSATVNINIANIDKSSPIANISYSTTKLTNQNVTATIKSNKEIQEVNGWNLSTDRKTLTKTYSENSLENVTIKDIAGNSTNINVNIKNIDKVAPLAKVSYDITEITNQNVKATILANEQLQEVEGWTLSSDKKTLTKTYTSNNTSQITIYDIAGNSAIVNINVSNIDNSSPIANISYSTTKLTNQNVTAIITSNKEIQKVEGWTLSDDRKTLTKTYTENSSENVTINDISGNSARIKVNILNIDKVIPIAKVSYNTTEITNQNVTATISANEQLQEIEGWTLLEDGKTLTRVFTENSQEIITIYDLAGNNITINNNIENIDKVIPVIEINYSTTSSTNEDVIVTITANEALKEIDGWNLSDDKKVLTRKFTSNTEENIIIHDLAGNTISDTIKVGNISKVEEKQVDTKAISNNDTLQKKMILPDTGEKSILIFIAIFTIIFIVMYIKFKKYKDVK